jgi:hypothetical protein
MKRTKWVTTRMAALALLLLVGSALAQTMQGELTDAEKKKTHTFKAQAGKLYQIDMTSDKFDTYLWLQDGTGKEIMKDDDSGDDGKNHNARLFFAPEAEGEYKIIAGSFGDNGKGAYTLNIQPLPEVKIGDKTKVTIGANDSKVKGNILFKGVAVKLEQGKTYKLDLTGDNNVIDPILAIGKPGAPKLEAIDDDGGGGLNSRIMFTPKTTGIYFVGCGSLGAKSGDLELTIQAGAAN